MKLENQIALCTEHYKKWKQAALDARDSTQGKKALERAFFWLELQTAFITLHAVEKVQGKNLETKKRIIVAKANLSRKLADYAQSILDEMKL